jgi:hypothetical protein
MSVQIKTKWIFLTILIALLAVFFSGWYIGNKRAYRVSTHVTDSLNSKIDSMYIVLKDRSFYAYEKEQEILTLKEALNKGLVDKETLKALNLKYISEVTQLKGKVRILIDSLATNGSVIYFNDCDSLTLDTTKVIKLPFTFEKIDKDYQIHGGFTNDGIMYESLTVPLALDVYTFWDKPSKAYKVIATTDNKTVLFNGVRSIKMDLQPPKKYGIGVFVGYGMTIEKDPRLTPMVGVGLSRTLIRF